jgi:hypothetical protein
VAETTSAKEIYRKQPIVLETKAVVETASSKDNEAVVKATSAKDNDKV